SIPVLMKSCVRAFLLALVLFAPTFVSATERRAVAATADAVAVPSTSPIVLDGKLNEEIWQQAPPVTDFLQRDPDEGQPPTMRTEARLAYDESALYIGVRAFDTEAGKIVGILTRRDQRSPSDWIRVIVDSYYDRRSGYE